MMYYLPINPMVEVMIAVKIKYISESKSQYVRDEAIDAFNSYFNIFGCTEKEIYNSRLMAYLIITLREADIGPAECYALNKKDVHENHVHIRCSLESNENQTEAIVATKTPTSIRDIPLSFTAQATFKSLMQYAQTDYLFADYYGNMFKSNYVSGLMTVAAKRSKENFIYIHFGTGFPVP